jgi:DNA-binding transcriptional ArsR family regulator
MMGGFTYARSCTYIGRMTTNQNLRAQAIDAAIESLDEAFFKALCEPSRVAVFKRVLLLGRADVGEIAKDLPQERSVISRHLQVLHDAQIVKATKVGRQVFYEVNGGAIVERLEGLLQRTKGLVSICCP